MTATWWLRSRGRYGLARAARAPVADSHSLSSFAILLAIFLKPIDVPEIRLNRTPFSESRGSLHTSISHCTWLSVAASPCAHSRRNRSRCSYWHLLASRTCKKNRAMKRGLSAFGAADFLRSLYTTCRFRDHFRDAKKKKTLYFSRQRCTSSFVFYFMYLV